MSGRSKSQHTMKFSILRNMKKLLSEAETAVFSVNNFYLF
jgi:hypothetical protein